MKTLVIDRNLFSRSQGYNLADKEKKKATQADIDDMMLRTHTNLDECGMSTNAMGSAQMNKYLSKYTDAEDAASSAFDGQLAKIGGISALDASLQQLPIEEQETGKDDSKEDGGSGSGSDSNSSGNGKKKKSKKGDKKDKKTEKKPKEIKIWLERDIVVSAAVREQEEWMAETKKIFEGVHSDMVKLLAEIEKENFIEQVKNESRFATTRTHACGLVLGLNDWTKLCDGEANSLKEVAQTTPKKGFALANIALTGL